MNRHQTRVALKNAQPPRWFLKLSSEEKQARLAAMKHLSEKEGPPHWSRLLNVKSDSEVK